MDYKQLRIYIDSANSYTGCCLVEALRNDHVNDINPHLIIGSVASAYTTADTPRGLKRVIDNNKPNVLTRVLLDSDVIIYDLTSSRLDEVDYAIRTLKIADFSETKIFVLISSITVWSGTPPKERKEDAGPLTGESEHEDDPKDGNSPYREEEYLKRRSLPRYEVLKNLESQCLAAGQLRRNLRTYVICPGILYGNGERLFYSLFKQAWLQQDPVLHYFGDGTNHIPTIHVKDLAEIVKKTVEHRPETRYIIAVDHSKKTTQKDIVQAISSGIGSGEVSGKPFLEAILDENYDFLTLNVNLCPTRAFSNLPETSQIEWNCRNGLEANFEKISAEFNLYRGLRLNKIAIFGPPASGKTHFGRLLSRMFNLPHILAKHVSEEATSLPNAFGEEVRNTLAAVKEKMLEEAQAALEALKKKKVKGIENEVDPNKIIPRIPDDLFARSFLWRLQKTDCVNRGYLLDGFPKTYHQAVALFTEEHDGNRVVNTKMLPETIILLKANDEFLKKRAQGLPEEVLTGSHYNEEGMNRRLAAFKKILVPDPGTESIFAFFKEHGITVYEVDVETATDDAIITHLKEIIERNGKFENSLDYDEVEEERKRREQQREQAEKERQRKEMEAKALEAEKEKRRQQDEDQKLKMKMLEDQEREILDTKSQPLRQYLADRVVPILTQGLLEVCKTVPEDPLDYLADFLLKNAPKALQGRLPEVRPI
eukprot:TRINITY_DN12791_c0_g1_i1.p1 TRINITY_DN12791_c0_g1~~TRINITY_DN12791_c0_g1_i1.p1  ORF type:complete len:709 (-),score=197.98 TRINITY_DN12791_c0_g1_i1:91-2217(-)